MPVVMQIVGIASSGVFLPGGTYLRSFDHEAHDGRGYMETTQVKSEAMRFPSTGDGMRFWLLVPECKKVREDGKPNRPLTAAHVMFEPVDS